VQPRGAVNLSNWIGGLAAAGVIYSAVIFGPPYLDNLDVRSATDAALTLGYMYRHELIAQKIMLQVNEGPTQVGTHWIQDEETLEWLERPGLGLEEDNIRTEANEMTKTLRIDVDYVRKVRLFPSKEFRDLHFHITRVRTE
jgi:hypothetical protein